VRIPATAVAEYIPDLV